MNACAQCAARARAICQSLSPLELDDLNRLGRRHTIRAGQTLQWQGADSMLVGNVIEGVLKLSVADPGGREQTLGMVFPGDFIGRPFGARSDHSIVALSEAKVCTFPRAAFDDFALSHPKLEHQLLRRTLGDLDRTRQWMQLLGRKSATERVAGLLLAIATRAAAPDEEAGAPVRFRLPCGRQELADILGLTIETVSRQFTKLREIGAIEIPDRRTVVVVDRAVLEDCAAVFEPS